MATILEAAGREVHPLKRYDVEWGNPLHMILEEVRTAGISHARRDFLRFAFGEVLGAGGEPHLIVSILTHLILSILTHLILSILTPNS